MERIFRPDGTVRRQWRQPALPKWLDTLAESVDQHEVDADAVYLAWELSTLAENGWVDSEREVFVRLVLASLIAMRQGSTRLMISDDGLPWFAANFADIVPVDDAAEFLENARRVLALEMLRPVVGRPADYRPLIVDGPWLYHQRSFAYEEALAGRISERAELAGRWQASDAEAAIAEVLANPPMADGEPMTLSDEQVAAIRAALGAPLTIITGGPGTGKTSIVVSLLRTLQKLGIAPDAIALAAPTGKAANRMAESIGAQIATLEDDDAARITTIRPTTLHRLLDYSMRRREFRHGRQNPLKHRVVIIDEASMIDLVLMERLVSAIRDDAQLILLGDAEQLPSVETGTILRDLIPAEGAEASDRAVVRLRQSFRMDASNPAGRAILQTAEFVRVGDASGALDAIECRDVGEIAYHGAEWVACSDDDGVAARRTLRDFLDRWYDDRVLGLEDLDALATDRIYHMRDGEFSPEDIADLDRLFAHVNSFRILCVTRVYAAGANAINELFHKRLLRRSPDLSPNAEYAPGEPVMMLKNDYDRQLFNGDQGLILRVDTDGESRFMAVFPIRGSYKAHHLNALRGQLDRAFAMTVHKSQGSEFDHVALVVPESDMPLLTREVLYTGITRARRSVTLVGRPSLLTLGVERQILRYSGVSERL